VRIRTFGLDGESDPSPVAQRSEGFADRQSTRPSGVKDGKAKEALISTTNRPQKAELINND
jgi:hypothetical protein